MARATFKPGAKFKRWSVAVDDPRRALKQIGALIVSESQEAFKTQQLGKDKWDERGVPNVYGIIADFHMGKAAPPKRRFESTPALMDTGALKKSIAMRVVSRRVIAVGTKLPYAGVLHKGGPIKSLPITESVQELLQRWLEKKGSAWRDDLEWLLSPDWTGEQLEGEVSARPIVGITKRTIADVKKIVGVEIMEAKSWR